MNHEATAQFHRELDTILESSRNNPASDFNPPCKAGCFWCCYEALFVSEHEVDYILASMTPTQIEELKPRLINWLECSKEMMKLPYSDNIGITYRLANIPCPLLVEGKCSVYATRPLGCRTFFAHSHPENCEMPMRTKQKFAEFARPDNKPNALDKAQMRWMLNFEKHETDHMGIMLARKILGMDIRSAAAQAFIAEKAQDNLPACTAAQ